MIRIFPVGRSPKKTRPSGANARGPGSFNPDWMTSRVPDTAAAGREATTIRARRRKTASEAASPFGIGALGRPRLIGVGRGFPGTRGPRPEPGPSIVLDAMRDTGGILPSGGGSRTTGPSEPATGEVVETEGDDDREEFAEEVEHPEQLRQREQSHEVHREAGEGDEVVGRQSMEE